MRDQNEMRETERLVREDPSLIPKGQRLRTFVTAAVILLAGWLLVVLAGVLAGPA